MNDGQLIVNNNDMAITRVGTRFGGDGLSQVDCRAI